MGGRIPDERPAMRNEEPSLMARPSFVGTSKRPSESTRGAPGETTGSGVSGSSNREAPSYRTRKWRFWEIQRLPDRSRVIETTGAESSPDSSPRTVTRPRLDWQSELPHPHQTESPPTRT